MDFSITKLLPNQTFTSTRSKRNQELELNRNIYFRCAAFHSEVTEEQTVIFFQQRRVTYPNVQLRTKNIVAWKFTDSFLLVFGFKTTSDN